MLFLAISAKAPRRSSLSYELEEVLSLSSLRYETHRREALPPSKTPLSPEPRNGLYHSSDLPGTGRRSQLVCHSAMVVDHRPSTGRVTYVPPTWAHLPVTSFSAFGMLWDNQRPVRINKATEKPCIPLDTNGNSRKASSNFRRCARPSKDAQPDVMPYSLLRPCARLCDLLLSFVITSSIGFTTQPR